MTDELTPEIEEVVEHYAVKEAGGQTFTVQLTPAEDTRTKILYCPTGRVIPIVYVHGMLSAALKAKGQDGVKDGTNVWKAPPSLVAGGLSILGSLEFFGYDAAKHQKRLDPKTTEVDYKGTVKWWYDSVKRKDAILKGWGAVWGMGEQPFLDKLQGALDDLKKIKLKEIGKSKKEFDWYALLNTDPAQYGGVNYMAAEQVTVEDLEVMQKYQFDVWVAPYNWLDAHEKQAEEVLLPRIRDTILGHYTGSDAPKKAHGWTDVYDSWSTHHDLDSQTMLPKSTKISNQMVKNPGVLWWSGDGTVAAASGEAPFVADIKGGYFLHGSEPAHQKLHEEFMSARLQKVVTDSNKPKEKPLIPYFNQADYEHAEALGDDLPYYSTLHAIVKIVVNAVDKELEGT